MKIKQIEIGAGYTFQPQQYHSLKAEVRLVVELNDKDEYDVVYNELYKDVINKIEEMIPGLVEVHERQKNVVGDW
jgi:hypothetical protein